ncbi:set domain-containing protein [Ophiostoma piceae UAMH 11346]|uniref:Set domain-containing protein n=1 Tax=Ophiostoma piceae (strain UAMH 11346) TaxID=1262450 RepID=S3CBH7_OPHP1|nr:set domain-containing protein [Ophiostoma piceae UAMH 11346]
MTSLENEPRFRRLRQWFEGLGGATHESVEVYLDPVSGVSLRAKPDSPAPVTGMIVSCPFAASLSYLDATAKKDRAAAFPPAFMDAVPPHVVGRFFLVQQYLLGPASHWYPYIAALPQPGDYASWALPAVWLTRSETAAVSLLRGTNAEVAAKTMAELITTEYGHAAALLDLDADEKAGYTPALYDWAYCMFTSRSFRPSLVLPEADAEAGVAVHEDSFSVLLPMLDLGNHAPAARVAWERQAHKASIDFSSLDACAAGRQIYNNYGSKTNSELLVGYGFVLPPTPTLHNDYVHLRKMGGPSVLMSAGASGESGGPPPSFLLGLRQMTDASSVVGRGRARLTRGAERSADFGRFEDGLLWDILLGICSGDEREQLTRYAAQKFGVSGDRPMEDVYAAASVAQLQAVIMDMVYGDEEEDDEDEKEDEEGDEEENEEAAEKEQFCMEKADAVRQTLTYKMYMDCKTLRSTDAESAATDKSGFEKLAAQYREQYRAVLEAAFTSLSGEEYESDDD